MILTERARIVSLVSAASLVIGFAAGVWWATPEATTFPPIIGQDQAECSTEIIAAPKNRLTLPDGTSIESDDPITLDVSETGDGSTFASSGEARSPGIRTSAGEQALKLALESGVPVIVRPDGTFNVQDGKGGGGSFDVDRGGSTGWLLVGLGAIVFLCGPIGFIFGKKIGVGLSTTEAGIISLAGVGLIGMGMYPNLAPMLVIGLAGLAAAYGVFYVVKSQRVGKVSARALAAARMVKAIDMADTGDGSPGDVIKKAVSANVGKGTDLEKVIDEIIAEAGA